MRAPVENTVAKCAAVPGRKKARSIAKAAKLERQAARDRLRIAKAQRTLAKLGSPTPDTTTQPSAPAAPADIAKANEDQVAGAIDLIAKAVGPLVEKDREEIRTELAKMSEQLARISKTALPGGPRVVLERDGSLIGAPEGEAGLSYEQAALAKVAERYPVGSVMREQLQKAAATSAIKDLMEARAAG